MEKAKCNTLGYTTASCSCVFGGLPSGGPNTNLGLFPPCHIWRCPTGMCRYTATIAVHMVGNLGDKVRKKLVGSVTVAVASPEILSLVSEFLGDSFCLPCLDWRFHNKLPGRLCGSACAMRSMCQHGDPPIGFHVVELACTCGNGCLGIVVNFSRWKRPKCNTLGYITASCRWVFGCLPLGGPNTKPQSFSALSHTH
jgi:hypothetical protein